MEQLPWDRHPSIYEHLQAHRRPGGRRLDETVEKLPDEERVAAGSQVRWAAGAKDGVFTHHWGGSNADEAIELLTLVRGYWETPTAANKARVYDFLAEKSVVSLIDPFLKALREEADVNHDRLYDLAKSFATEAPHREPVKLGIAVLGLYAQEQDRDVFRTLGRHDEFTLFATVALANAAEDAEAELWELANDVQGWGRVHVVERLANTEDPAIKDWLLREGYRNSVMYEYLAYPCAVGGGLRAALERDDVDDGLLAAAGEIIQALTAGGPAANLDDYEEGAAVVERYLDLMGQHATSLPQLLSVHAVLGFLGNDEADWEARAGRGWTPKRRAAMQRQCSAIIECPAWPEWVLAGLRSENEQEFYLADQAATVLGIAAGPLHWDHLRQRPLEPGRWFHVMKGCTEAHIADVVALAEARLPLDQIATGPGTELGLGPGYEAHSCLDYLLQELGRFPGQGVRLIAAGLQSPDVRNRNMALKALSEWGRDRWPEGMAALLGQARDREPDAEVRRRIENVLAGRPLEDNPDKPSGE